MLPTTTQAAQAANNTGLPASVTLVRSTKGDLNKRIELLADGTVKKTHPLPMSEGWSSWHAAPDGEALAALISDMPKDHALILGQLKNTTQYQFPVLSKRKALSFLGPSVVRSKEFFHFDNTQNSWALLDHDTKDMPASVQANIERAGGWQQAALQLWPDLARAEAVDTASSSSHITKPDGQSLQAAASHKYVLYWQRNLSQKDLLADLLLRGWLHGLSYWVVGAAGQLLERGLFDAAVGSPERLSFEAPPTLSGGLTRCAPAPTVTRGEAVGYAVLAPKERAKALKTRRVAKDAMRAEAARVKAAWVEDRARELMAERGLTYDQAMATVRGLFQRKGQLFGEYNIQLSDYTWVTVNDILDDPHKYHMVDGPGILDGVEYGMSRIQIVTLGKDGDPLRRPHVIDYAHGINARYELVGVNKTPSVTLNRPARFSFATSATNRAESWEKQKAKLDARNQYQFDQQIHLWRTKGLPFLEGRKRKPRTTGDTEKDTEQLGRWQATEDARTPPVWWDASQTGVGKSYARDKFVRWIVSDPHSGWNRKKHGPVVIVLERHEQIEKALDVLDGLNVVATVGRAKVCKFPKQIAALSGLVSSVERSACDNCPLREHCEYYERRDAAQTADVVIMPREQAYYKPENIVGKKVALWLFDEDQMDVLLSEELHITQADLTVTQLLDALPPPLQAMVQLPNVSQTLAALSASIPWPSRGAAIAPVKIEHAEEVLGYLQKPQTINVTASEDAEEFESLLGEAVTRHEWGSRWCQRVAALLRAVMQSQGQNHLIGCTMSTTTSQGMIPASCVTVSTRQDISGFNTCHKAPRVLYSATADQTLNKLGLDFGAPDRDNISLPAYVTIRYMDCHTGSANSLTDHNGPTALSLKLAAHFNDQAADGPGLWVSQKAVKEAVLPHLSAETLTLHYGAVTSVNAAAGVPYTMICGRPLPNPGVYEAQVEVLLGRCVQRLPAGEYWPLADGYVRCGAYHELSTRVYTHPDPHVNHYLGYKLRTHVEQAIGRPRAIRAEHPMVIDVFGNVPIGYPVDQLGALDEFAAGPEELICRKGLVPLTGEAVNKLAPLLFPDLYRNAAQVQKAREYVATHAKAEADQARDRERAGLNALLRLNPPVGGHLPADAVECQLTHAQFGKRAVKVGVADIEAAQAVLAGILPGCTLKKSRKRYGAK
ncbi:MULTISPECIES: hypothetical protein [Leisingera]|jgi:hypothetical protein|uniref:hypothetical protein n=1 Tax=Leisingera TaxID=191028 RepID=UPI001150D5A4|nr:MULTISPECIES: hypothetical protein [Leisingera]QDI75231.1 hypothetical protein R2C4_05490 [Leisingera aquaemixtae]